MDIEKTKDQFILNGCYHVPFESCDTTDKIILRVAELSRQPWCGSGLLFAFIAAATNRLGLDIGAAGWPQRGAGRGRSPERAERGEVDAERMRA